MLKLLDKPFKAASITTLYEFEVKKFEMNGRAEVLIKKLSYKKDSNRNLRTKNTRTKIS